MIDYYPVIARAVSRLEDNTASARLELYGHARTILAAQLRKLEPPRSASQIKDELIALESAMRRVEAETLSPRPEPATDPAPALPQPSRAAVAAAGNEVGIRHERATVTAEKTGAPARTTAEPTAVTAANAITTPKIVTAPTTATEAKTATKTVAEAKKAAPEKAAAEPQVRPPPAAPRKGDGSKKRAANAADDMGAIPASLGAMLVGITFVVGTLAFIGVVYIRGLVLVSANVIGYPTLLVVTSTLSCLFALLAFAIFRKARIVSAIDFLLKLTYSALPREL